MVVERDFVCLCYSVFTHCGNTQKRLNIFGGVGAGGGGRVFLVTVVYQSLYQFTARGLLSAKWYFGVYYGQHYSF